ncbi:ABC transporter permease [Microbacterium sp. NPDC003461]
MSETTPSPTRRARAAQPPSRVDSVLRDALREILAGSVVRGALAILIAFVVGAILIVSTNDNVVSSAGYFFARPMDTLSAMGHAIGEAYGALFRGAIYNTQATSFEAGIRPLTETARFAGPLIAAGLGVALSFRVGMFNIGGQGQLLVAAGCAMWAATQWQLPGGLHLVAAIVFGLIGGSVWGAIVGFLKAQTGAHEVIVTIMLNYVAVNVLTWVLRTSPMHNPGSGNDPTSMAPAETAQLPALLGPSFQLHLGFVLAIAAAVLYWWLMERSSLGFKFRAVGLNADAARTAGIDVERIYVYTMAASGAFVALAGVNQALGRTAGFTPSIDAGIGWDAITVALLGGSRAGGVVFAGLLFGAFKAASATMQFVGVAPEVMSVVQGVIVLFIAAPPLVRAIFRLPAPGAGVRAVLARTRTTETQEVAK